MSISGYLKPFISIAHLLPPASAALLHSFLLPAGPSENRTVFSLPLSPLSNEIDLMLFIHNPCHKSCHTFFSSIPFCPSLFSFRTDIYPPGNSFQVLQFPVFPINSGYPLFKTQQVTAACVLHSLRNGHRHTGCPRRCTSEAPEIYPADFPAPCRKAISRQSCFFSVFPGFSANSVP